MTISGKEKTRMEFSTQSNDLLLQIIYWNSFEMFYSAFNKGLFIVLLQS